MPDPDPTFTLEHTEERWRVQLTQGEKDYAITVTRFGTGKVSLAPFKDYHAGQFCFTDSDANTVLAVGRLLIAAARKAGADAA